MLQRGISLSTLSSSFVSSLSYYFLAAFGLRGVLSLFMDPGVSGEEAMMQAQMGMVGGGPQQFDPAKAYKDEAERLQLMPHTSALDNIEAELAASAQ